MGSSLLDVHRGGWRVDGRGGRWAGSLRTRLVLSLSFSVGDCVLGEWCGQRPCVHGSKELFVHARRGGGDFGERGRKGRKAVRGKDGGLGKVL